MSTQFTTTGTLQLQRVMHPAGSVVTIDDAAEAQRLLALRAIVPVSGAAVLGGGTFVASANAKDTIAFVRTASAEDLLTVEHAERERPDGPRKSVLEAIDARAEALTAPSADDEDDAR